MLDDIFNGLIIPDKVIDKYELDTDEKLIRWQSRNCLLLQRILQRGYKITYSIDGRNIVLNELTQSNTDFYLTRGNHRYLLEGPSQTNKGRPEILVPLSKIEQDESQMLEVFHEIGHDRTKRELSETRSRLALEEDVSVSFMEKWEERQAWAYALRLKRELGLKFNGLDNFGTISARIAGYLKAYGAQYSYR